MAKLEAGYSYTDEELLAIFREAYAKCAVEGQTYEFMGQKFTRADLQTLANEIDRLEKKVSAAANGLISVGINLKRA